MISFANSGVLVKKEQLEFNKQVVVIKVKHQSSNHYNNYIFVKGKNLEALKEVKDIEKYYKEWSR